MDKLETDEFDFARLGPSLNQDVSNDLFIVQKLSSDTGQVYWRERDRIFIVRSGPDVVEVSPQGSFSESREEGRSGRPVDQRIVRPAFKGDYYFSGSWSNGSRPIQVVDFVKTARDCGLALIFRNIASCWEGVAGFSLRTASGELTFRAAARKRMWSLFTAYWADLELFFPPDGIHDHVILMASNPMDNVGENGTYHIRLRHPEGK